MLPIKTILHPTDFSDRSGQAFRLACALARDYGARLIVVHVAEIPMTVAAEGLVIVPTAVDMKILQAKLENLSPEDPKIQVERQLLEGDPASAILHVVEESKCNLIVMGTHGRTGLGRLLMGSVAEQVLRKAQCPVLTVKTPFKEMS